jgi:hypothetical protein
MLALPPILIWVAVVAMEIAWVAKVTVKDTVAVADE